MHTVGGRLVCVLSILLLVVLPLYSAVLAGTEGRTILRQHENFSAVPDSSNSPDFTIGLNTSSLALAFGSQVRIGGVVTGLNGFSQTVGLSVNISPVPPGTTADGFSGRLV